MNTSLGLLTEIEVENVAGSDFTVAVTNLFLLAPVANWQSVHSREQEVMGSIPSCNIPKS